MRPAGRAGSLSTEKRKWRDRLAGLDDAWRPPRRRGRALRAADAGAQRAGRPDRRDIGLGKVEAVGIDDPPGVAKVAAEADGELAVLARIEPDRALDGARD